MRARTATFARLGVQQQQKTRARAHQVLHGLRRGRLVYAYYIAVPAALYACDRAYRVLSTDDKVRRAAAFADVYHASFTVRWCRATAVRDSKRCQEV